eukprot:scaffold16595_cov232-Amphora_coffeaeformis.AAC.11
MRHQTCLVAKERNILIIVVAENVWEGTADVSPKCFAAVWSSWQTSWLRMTGYTSMIANKNIYLGGDRTKINHPYFKDKLDAFQDNLGATVNRVVVLSASCEHPEKMILVVVPKHTMHLGR